MKMRASRNYEDEGSRSDVQDDTWESGIWKGERSHFRLCSDKMKEVGFDSRVSTGGTKAASALMHTAFVGDEDDVLKILNKRDDDDDDDDDRFGDIEKKVIGWAAALGPTWENVIDEKDDQSWTALHFAASNGQASVIEAILRSDEGEQDLVNSKEGMFEWTPMFLAAIGLHIDCVKMLLSNGADANMKDTLGDTALDCMPVKRSRRRDEIRSLLKRHMDPDKVEFSSESEDEESDSEECESDNEEEDYESEPSYCGECWTEDDETDEDDEMELYDD